MKSAALGPLGAPTTLRSAIVSHLRKAIVAGQLAPGVLLKEVELARQLGVSATPIREALAELAVDGLVEIEPNRLKRVAPLNPAGIYDTLMVQSILWRQGYIWGIPRIGKADLSRLAVLNEDYERGVQDDNRLAAIVAGLDFHALIIRASGNSELLRVTLDRQALLARFALLTGSMWRLRTGPQQNWAILDAIKQKDTARALDKLAELTDEIVSVARDVAADQDIRVQD